MAAVCLLLWNHSVLLRKSHAWILMQTWYRQLSTAVLILTSSVCLKKKNKSQFLHLYCLVGYTASFCFTLIFNHASLLHTIFSLMIWLLTFSVTVLLSDIYFGYEKYMLSGKMWFLMAVFSVCCSQTPGKCLANFFLDICGFWVLSWVTWESSIEE